MYIKMYFSSKNEFKWPSNLNVSVFTKIHNNFSSTVHAWCYEERLHVGQMHEQAHAIIQLASLPVSAASWDFHKRSSAKVGLWMVRDEFAHAHQTRDSSSECDRDFHKSQGRNNRVVETKVQQS